MVIVFGAYHLHTWVIAASRYASIHPIGVFSRASIATAAVLMALYAAEKPQTQNSAYSKQVQGSFYKLGVHFFGVPICGRLLF